MARSRLLTPRRIAVLAIAVILVLLALKARAVEANECPARTLALVRATG